MNRYFIINIIIRNKYNEQITTTSTKYPNRYQIRLKVIEKYPNLAGIPTKKEDIHVNSIIELSQEDYKDYIQE